jgi:hypothetical protein
MCLHLGESRCTTDKGASSRGISIQARVDVSPEVRGEDWCCSNGIILIIGRESSRHRWCRSRRNKLSADRYAANFGGGCLLQIG